MVPSTSPSRNGSGTTTASTARSARCRWWAEASSRRGTTSCAPTAGRTSERPRLRLPHPPRSPLALHADALCFLRLHWAMLQPGAPPLRDFPSALLSDPHLFKSFNPHSVLGKKTHGNLRRERALTFCNQARPIRV